MGHGYRKEGNIYTCSSGRQPLWQWGSRLNVQISTPSTAADLGSISYENGFQKMISKGSEFNYLRKQCYMYWERPQRQRRLLCRVGTHNSTPCHILWRPWCIHQPNRGRCTSQWLNHSKYLRNREAFSLQRRRNSLHSSMSKTNPTNTHSRSRSLRIIGSHRPRIYFDNLMRI